VLDLVASALDDRLKESTEPAGLQRRLQFRHHGAAPTVVNRVARRIRRKRTKSCGHDAFGFLQSHVGPLDRGVAAVLVLLGKRDARDRHRRMDRAARGDDL